MFLPSRVAQNTWERYPFWVLVSWMGKNKHDFSHMWFYSLGVYPYIGHPFGGSKMVLWTLNERTLKVGCVGLCFWELCETIFIRLNVAARVKVKVNAPLIFKVHCLKFFSKEVHGRCKKNKVIQRRGWRADKRVTIKKLIILWSWQEMQPSAIVMGNQCTSKEYYSSHPSGVWVSWHGRWFILVVEMVSLTLSLATGTP